MFTDSPIEAFFHNKVNKYYGIHMSENKATSVNEWNVETGESKTIIPLEPMGVFIGASALDTINNRYYITTRTAIREYTLF